MNAIFNDMQDQLSWLNGTTVYDRNEVLAVLNTARDREPFCCELVGDNGYKLTLGVAKQAAFAQHSPSSGDLPYLLAVAPERHCEQEYVEFLVGDTPTPIPQRFCLTFEVMSEIAAHFAETGERSSDVVWEEI